MMVEPADKKWMHGVFGPRVRFDAPLADFTSFKIGGPADVLVEPQSEEELRKIVQWARRNTVPYLVLGGGTNVLVRDGGFRGVVIAMGQHWSDLAWRVEQGLVRVEAAAGVPLRRICRLAVRHGWEGIHFALGIPGTVGGAVLMNAGTREGSMIEVVHTITVMTAEGKVMTIGRNEIDSTYRSIQLPPRVRRPGQGAPVLVSAELSMAKGDPGRIRRRAMALIRSRVKGQPTWKPSAGCVFKNPSEATPAGRLIEAAGLKGATAGGAQISRRHANFIVNTGGATARDVLALISLAKKTVEIQHGVHLEPEVRIVGQEKDNAQESA